ncbi:MAG TPA: sigma-70 family RNA polymerase sigma factor [Candidatus Udaeobacter sp.]|nr:sigma-70 family RNA polymerase sigma factor [Candidatus Udaeobacter sp.]
MANQRLSAETFEELALPLFDQLYNFARWLTHNAPEAEDLVQETYVKALRGFSGFQLGTNFRAWMFRILRNTFLTSRTGLKSPAMSNDEVDFDKIATASPNPESVLIAQANRELVRQGLTDLPLPYREILLLCEVEEMSYEDIAQVLAVPLGTVMSRLHRARKALRALLAEKFKGAPDGL